MSTRLRASSLPDLLDCPSRWEAVHLLGRTKPFSTRAFLGQSIHDATAFFDMETQVFHRPTDDVLPEAENRFSEKFQEHHLEWRADKQNTLPFSKAHEVGLQLLRLYALEISPKFHFTAIEVTFADFEVDVDGVVIRLTGTADRICEQDSQFFLLDLKSGKRRVSQDGSVHVDADKPQLGVYELLAEQKLNIAITLPAIVAGLDTQTGLAQVSEPLSGCRELVVGTENRPGVLHAAAMYLRSGIFPPNPKSQLCSEQYCPNYSFCHAHP